MAVVKLTLLDCIVGQMTLEIPSFLTVSHDATTLKTSLSVQDPEAPHQRAMWGMFPVLHLASVDNYLITRQNSRYNPRSLAKSHHRRLGRTYLRFEFGWCRLQGDY